jgi:hypothetical protein
MYTPVDICGLDGKRTSCCRLKANMLRETCGHSGGFLFLTATRTREFCEKLLTCHASESSACGNGRGAVGFPWLNFLPAIVRECELRGVLRSWLEVGKEEAAGSIFVPVISGSRSRPPVLKGLP